MRTKSLGETKRRCLWAEDWLWEMERHKAELNGMTISERIRWLMRKDIGLRGLDS